MDYLLPKSAPRSYTVCKARVSTDFVYNAKKMQEVLSTSSPEKDTLLAPTVHKKIAHEILKEEIFL